MKKLRWALVTVLLTTSFATVASAGPSTLDRCISTLADSTYKLHDKWGRCASACEDAKRRGELGSEVVCSFPSGEPFTQRCYLRAAERLTGASSPARKICKNDEIALFYGNSQTCSGSNGTVDELLACLQDRVAANVEFLKQDLYHPVRSPVCGDGVITSPFEECDPFASPSGCTFDSVCHPRFCFCTFRGCGNGILEPGEDCDFNAFPDGCTFDQFCEFQTCRCRGGSASEAFLEMPRDLTR